MLGSPPSRDAIASHGLSDHLYHRPERGVKSDGLREVQVDAAEVVALAERAIAKASPAPTAQQRGSMGGRPRKAVTSDNEVSGDVFAGEDLGVSATNLRQIRQAHDNLTDEQFEQVAGERPPPLHGGS